MLGSLTGRLNQLPQLGKRYKPNAGDWQVDKEKILQVVLLKAI